MAVRAFKYFTVPPEERRLFLHSLWLLVFWKLITSLLPMRMYRTWLGKEQVESAKETRQPLPYVQTLICSINRAARTLPSKPKCLTEAITAKRLLDKHGIESTLYLGVAKNGPDSLIAHAWLRCGNIIVTGQKGMNKYTVVAVFT